MEGDGEGFIRTGLGWVKGRFVIFLDLVVSFLSSCCMYTCLFVCLFDMARYINSSYPLRLGFERETGVHRQVG